MQDSSSLIYYSQALRHFKWSYSFLEELGKESSGRVTPLSTRSVEDYTWRAFVLLMRKSARAISFGEYLVRCIKGVVGVRAHLGDQGNARFRHFTRLNEEPIRKVITLSLGQPNAIARYNASAVN